MVERAKVTPALVAGGEAMKTTKAMMSDLSEDRMGVGPPQAPGRWNIDLHAVRSAILRYCFSILCIGIALALSLGFQYYQFRDVEAPPFTLAVAVVTWYAGFGPSVLAILLSMALFDYFFTEPLYSFEISSREIPNFMIFIIWWALVASFAAVPRQIEASLRSARAELAKRAAELEAANKELESFTYSVSHDLRAPLRHVTGYAELLQKQASASLDDKGHRYLAMILEASKKMGSLIDDLLRFTRIARVETRKTDVSLDRLVREVIADVAEDTKDRDIAWTIGSLPVCYGDRSMLKVVLVNLLSNAVKFTRKRSQAAIEIGCIDGKENQVELFVKDNGAGFEMQHVDKLFGVFQRLHRTEDFEGTGIGLATVQRIIQRHGGQVRAEAAVDQGATFYFSLPRGASGEAGTHSDRPGRPERTGAHPYGAR